MSSDTALTAGALRDVWIKEAGYLTRVLKSFLPRSYGVPRQWGTMRQVGERFGGRMADQLSRNDSGMLGEVLDTMSSTSRRPGRPLVKLYQRAMRHPGGIEGYLEATAGSPNASQASWLRRAFEAITEGQAARSRWSRA